MSVLDQRLTVELERIRAADLYRVRRVIAGSHGVNIHVDGRSCLNFCSNDYLGMAADPRVTEAAKRALARVGTGSGAAALVSGYNAEHAQLEEELAAFVGRPRALLFSSGWAANLGVLRALCGRQDTIIADELNHASLIDGARLAGSNYVRVGHRDLAAYAQALAQPRGGQTLVVTDSVFSMDGDLADLPALAELSRAHAAALVVDDAHGLGVLGCNGRGVQFHPYAEDFSLASPQGLASTQGLSGLAGSDLEGRSAGRADGLTPDCHDRVSDLLPDVYVATLGKSLGAAGAFVAGSEALIEFLIQRGRTWVFSTAPPPAIAAAARMALQVIQAEPEHRLQLLDHIRYFDAGLRARGLRSGAPHADGVLTPIQPLILGDEARTLAVSRALFERGYWVAGIRPPTVPRGTSRLRITLSAAHTRAQIDGLLDALFDVLPAQSFQPNSYAVSDSAASAVIA